MRLSLLAALSLVLVPATGQAQGLRIRSVTAGFEVTCAVGEDGRAWCWGGMARGFFASRAALVGARLLVGAPPLVTLSATFRTACGLGVDSIVRCVGENALGLLGSGSPMSAPSGRMFSRARLAPVAGALRFRAVELRGTTACGVATDGRVWCWGGNGGGQFGNGSTDSTAVFSETNGCGGNEPVAASSPVAFATVSVNFWHACALTAEGAAWCWGSNTYGQLGDGTTTAHLAPGPVAGDYRFRSITVGTFGTCGVTLAGDGLCWGRNPDGLVGDGTQQDRHVPTPVAGGRRWQSIEAGTYHVCGVADDGAAWCWGRGVDGALGTGIIGEPLVMTRSIVQALQPVAVVGGLRFASIAVGSDHTCGVTVTAEVWCWGGNAAGQLGLPSDQFRGGTGTPQRVPILDTPARAPRR